MPQFVVNTNVPKSKIPANWLKETSALVAKILGKPESYVTVCINPDIQMSFGGTTDPAAQCLLMSIGQLGKDKNVSHSGKLCKHLTDTLGIPADRMYITFHDAPKYDVGWNGTTFGTLL